MITFKLKEHQLNIFHNSRLNYECTPRIGAPHNITIDAADLTAMSWLNCPRHNEGARLTPNLGILLAPGTSDLERHRICLRLLDKALQHK